MSTSGIKNVNKNSPIEALIFINNICPRCGNNLQLEHKFIRKGEFVTTKFHCPICRFECPIKHDNGNMIPLYDQSIYSFINTFGDNIIDRRNKLLQASLLNNKNIEK